MVARSVVASTSPSLLGNHGADRRGESSGELAAERAFDLHRFRVVFPDRWASFLKAHFRNQAQIAAFFDVDDKTARNWLEGTTKPSAPTALIAIVRIPGALRDLTGVAA